VDVDRVENLTALSSVVEVCVDARLAAERERLWLLLFKTVPNTSPPLPMTPGKRFLEMASNPKMAALERRLAVGVDGIELCPVRNLNKPN
jgi:hypothetical protein